MGIENLKDDSPKSVVKYVKKEGISPAQTENTGENFTKGKSKIFIHFSTF